MAYNLMMQLLPDDIVDFCITPFLSANEHTVRSRFKKVLAELEEGKDALKGRYGLYYTIPLKLNDDRTAVEARISMPPEYEKILRENCDMVNDQYLDIRRALIAYGLKADDLEPLSLPELQTLWNLQFQWCEVQKRIRLKTMSDGSELEKQFLAFAPEEVDAYDLYGEEWPPWTEEDAASEEQGEWIRSQQALLHLVKTDSTCSPDVLGGNPLAWVIGINSRGQGVCRRIRGYRSAISCVYRTPTYERSTSEVPAELFNEQGPPRWRGSHKWLAD